MDVLACEESNLRAWCLHRLIARIQIQNPLVKLTPTQPVLKGFLKRLVLVGLLAMSEGADEAPLKQLDLAAAWQKSILFVKASLRFQRWTTAQSDCSMWRTTDLE